MIKEFNINFTKKEISLIYQKVKEYPWDSIANLEKWDHGTNKSYLKELCKYWVTDFDWNKQETELNKLSNFTTTVDGNEIHFIKEKGSSLKFCSFITYAWMARICSRIFRYY
jgi:microsomal epoxide hydrolase